MAYPYAPRPTYVVTSRPPAYRGGAVFAWVMVNIWNTLGCLGLLGGVIMSIFGAGALLGAASSVGADERGSVMGAAGASSAVVIGVSVGAFVFALIVTICTYAKLWGVLLLQTIWYLLCSAAATFYVARVDIEAMTRVPAWVYLAVVWGCWALWLLFTILTAPGLARRPRQ